MEKLNSQVIKTWTVEFIKCNFYSEYEMSNILTEEDIDIPLNLLFPYTKEEYEDLITLEDNVLRGVLPVDTTGIIDNKEFNQFLGEFTKVKLLW